jgi:hypothetical protein
MTTTTKERPIPFSGAMVRALLAGTKTQTRRVIKDQQIGERFSHMTDDGRAHLEWLGTPSCGTGVWDVPEHSAQVASPYGQPGDRLWVREAWRAYAAFNKTPPRDITPDAPIWYEAQDEVPFHPTAYGKLRPGIFMPRWASRILLKVTQVRVERLQDISKADAMAEGITFTDYGLDQWQQQRQGWGVEPTSHMRCMHSAPAAYGALWEQINGAGSWNANPWVWAVSFRRIDNTGAAA